MSEPATPPELEGLEATDWQGLQHCYGPADDVPGLLRQLLAGSEAEREEALSQLWNSLCHQGTVYEATAHVVPFLHRLLASSGPPGPVPLLSLLAAIAEGGSYLEAHALPEEGQPIDWRQVLAQQGRDFDQELERERAWVEAAREAIGQGLPLYLDLLAEPDREIQQLALTVLARLPERAAEIVPRLQALLAATGEPGLRGEVVGALHRLMDAGPAAQQFFAKLLAGETAMRVAFLAAAALVERAGPATPEEAAAKLLESLQEMGQVGRDAFDFEDEGTAWQWEDQELALRAAVRLGPGRSEAVLLEALPSQRSPEDALELAGVLLDLAFHEGQVQDKGTATGWSGQDAEARQTIDYWRPEPQPPRAAASLSAQQRAVLVALVGHGPLWMPEHNLLALYGLPSTHRELRQFLG
jgi:hypothetical protein